MIRNLFLLRVHNVHRTDILAIKEATNSRLIIDGSRIHGQKPCNSADKWLRSFTAKLSIPYSGATTLNVDNQGTINYSINAINHSHIKHIDIQHHFVHEKLISNKIEIQYCATENNLADLFTKALPKPRHEDLAKRLGMA